jgi:hypothetical protein
MSYELKTSAELQAMAAHADQSELLNMLAYAKAKHEYLTAKGKGYRAKLWTKTIMSIEGRLQAPIMPKPTVTKAKAAKQAKPAKPVMSAKILAGIVESYLMQRANAGMEYAEFKIGNAKFRIGTAEQAIKNYIKGLKKIKAQHIGEFSPV